MWREEIFLFIYFVRNIRYTVRDMKRLPPETWALISSFLRPQEYLNLALVCREFWHEVYRLGGECVYSSCILRAFPNLRLMNGPVVVDMSGLGFVRSGNSEPGDPPSYISPISTGCNNPKVSGCLWWSSSIIAEVARISSVLKDSLEVWWPGYWEDTKESALYRATNLERDFLDILPYLLDLLETRVRKYPHHNLCIRFSRLLRVTYNGSTRSLKFIVPIFRIPHHTTLNPISSQVFAHEVPNLEMVMERITALNVRSLTFPLMAMGPNSELRIATLHPSHSSSDELYKKAQEFFAPFQSIGVLVETRGYWGPTSPCCVTDFHFWHLESLCEPAPIQQALSAIPRDIRSQILRLHNVGPIEVEEAGTRECLKNWNPAIPWTLVFGSRFYNNKPADVTHLISLDHSRDIRDRVSTSFTRICEELSTPTELPLEPDIANMYLFLSLFPTYTFRFLYYPYIAIHRNTNAGPRIAYQARMERNPCAYPILWNQ